MKDPTAVMCHNIAKYDQKHNMPDLTPQEIAEAQRFQQILYWVECNKNQNKLSGADIKTIKTAASILHRVASGELKPVVHAYPVMKHRHLGGYKYTNCPDCGAEIEIEHPVACDVPYCSNCGAELAESFQDACPRCGALMGGKEDSHE